MIEDFEGRVRHLIGDYIYGIDDETLAGAIGKMLVVRSLSVATAESASGGLLGSYFTDTPGSSEWYRGGVVAYSADLKRWAGVPPEVIDQHGTVAPETSIAMAKAARAATGAEAGIGITGVAGPSEVEGKPVGTAHIALDFLGETRVASTHWSTTRLEYKRRAVLDGMYLLWRELTSRARVHA
jgi:nicotinamide-nucleotide amidase